MPAIHGIIESASDVKTTIVKESKMKRFLCIRALWPAVFILCGLFITGSGKAAAQTVFNSDGTIAAGEKSVCLDKDGGLLFQLGAQQLKFSLYFFKCNPQTGKDETFFTTVNLADKRLTVDTEKKESVFKGSYRDKESGLSFEVTVVLARQDDGSARVNISYDNEALFQKKLVSHHSYYNDSMPFYLFDGQKVKVDDQEFLINQDAEKTDIRPAPESVALFAGNPGREITFLTDWQPIVFQVNPGKTLALFLPENFGIDLGAGQQAGEPKKTANYYPSDELYGPRFDLCRNLVQNPSFESGFRYWQMDGGVNYPQPNNFVIDSTVFYQGKKSLRLYGRKGLRLGLGYPTTFVMAVEPGQGYTLSFYAKADSSQNLSFYTIEGRGVSSPVAGTLESSVLLTSEWQRYQVSCKPRDKILAIAFHIQYPTQDVTAWIDCVQLEKGDLTEYTEKPVTAELVTNNSDNLLQPDEKMDSRLEIHTLPGMKGDISLEMRDFFSRVVYQEKLSFIADQEGFASLSLPLDKKRLGTGDYIMTADFKLESGYSDQDWFRLGIMKYLNNDFRHKNMFAVYILNAGESIKIRAERWKRIGVGAGIAFNPQPQAVTAELDRNNILSFSSIFRNGSYAGESPDAAALDNSNLKGPKEFVLTDNNGGWANERYDPEVFTPEVLKTVEETSYQKTAMYPEIKYWKLANEPWWINDLEKIKTFVPIMEASYHGIKRANPQAKVISPDPPGMGPGGGTKWLDTYLADGGISTFDIIAAHPYRKTPEEPDLDFDTADLITMLDRHGYQGDIWFTEGAAWMHHILPVYGLDPDDYSGSWEYRAGTISYDQGYGEKLATAYLAHFWLVSLKYSSRVKMNLAWVPSLTTMDLNMTPRADIWVTNTLGHVLGNADYRQNLPVSDDIRGYLFEDENKRPVAVFYNTNPGVSRRLKEAPALILPFAKDEVEVIDLMGNSRLIEKNESLPVTPFPVFIRGKAGTWDSFYRKLSQDLSGADVTQLKPSVKVTGATKAEVSLQNLFSSRVSGRVKIESQGKIAAEKNIALDGQKNVTLPITLPSLANTFEPISLRISFLPEGKSQPQIKDLSFVLLSALKRTKPIMVDGDLSDWDQQYQVALPDNFKDFPVPADFRGEPVPWKGENDLSAILYTAWDEDYFYLAVKVQDDVFAPPPSLSGAFKYDSLQVYFDTLADARNKGTFKGFDGNDYNYDFYPLKEGPEVIRSYAAEWQLSFLKPGPAPEVSRAFRKTADGYIYEMAFPARTIVPLALKAGSSFGFALLVNDNDHDYRKRGLTLTPAGNEPYMNPHLYPVMVLE